MTQEDKELLLKDLCARLPYGIKFKSENAERVYFIDTSDNEIYINGTNIEDVKPYLFPLSSMTEEQSLELFELFGIDILDSTIEDYIKINEVTGITFFLQKGFDVETHLDKLIDWLLKNHFDFRGLIPKGLALDATGRTMYQ